MQQVRRRRGQARLIHFPHGLSRPQDFRNEFEVHHGIGIAMDVHPGFDQTLEQREDDVIVATGAENVAGQEERRTTARRGRIDGLHGRDFVEQLVGELAELAAREEFPAAYDGRPKGAERGHGPQLVPNRSRRQYDSRTLHRRRFDEIRRSVKGITR